MSLRNFVDSMLSKMSGPKQMPIMAVATINNGAIIFKQREILISEEADQLVIIPSNKLDDDLTIQITYNTGLTVDVKINKFTDRYYPIFVNTIKAYKITNITIQTQTQVNEVVTKGISDSVDTLNKYASSLPSTITDEDGTVYTLDVDYQLVNGKIDWNMPYIDIAAAVAEDNSVLTTETTAAQESTADDMTLLPTAAVQLEDKYYFGATLKFNRLIIQISTGGVGIFSGLWEYYDGSDWLQTPANIVDGTDEFKTAGKTIVYFTEPIDWVSNSINSITKYWLRYSLNSLTTYTTAPKGQQAWTDREPRKDASYTFSYNYIPAGEEGYEMKFYTLKGNTSKLLSLHDYSLSQIRNISYQMLKYTEINNATGDWLTKVANSWNLNRLGEETDDQLRIRIISAQTSTNGTIQSITDNIVNYLNLDTIPSITESYNTTDSNGNTIAWLIGESKFLPNNQSELVFSGGDPIKPMQSLINITGYTGTLTASDIEDYLRKIINVSVSVKVTLS